MQFVYKGEIRGQGRPRFRRIGKGVSTYENKEDREYKEAIKQAYLDAGGESFGDAPIRLVIETYRKMPKSRPRKIEWEDDTFKPDADNICKAVMDALNGVAWKDDKQITMCTVIKNPRLRFEGPEKMYITVERLY